MRQVARAHGHPGAYFVAVQNNPWLLDYGNGGFDAATAYAYGFCDVPWGGPDRSLPYEAVIPRHHECFQIARQRAVSGGMGYIPSAWVGWDDIARAGPRSVRTVGNDPAAFRAMMAGLPHGADPDLGLALYESWNEWGEGGQSEPGVPYGFGRLSAIRDALSDERGPYEISVPPDDEIAAMQTDITWREVRDMYWRRHARKLGLQDGFEASFDSQRSLWFRGAGDARRTRIEDGRLRGRSTGDDPVLHGPPLMDLKPESVMTVEVRMRSHAGDSAQLYWSTEEDQDWSEARSIELPLQAGEDCAVYRFDVAAHTEWRGTIRAFRLDPGNAPGEFALDSVRTLPR
jgi:hypothetical protein